MTQSPEDDLPLLELMLSDLQKSDPLFKPTNFWNCFQEQMISELRTKGLKDFRSRHDSVLSAFGATDLSPISNYTYHIDGLGIRSKLWLMIRYLSRIPQANTILQRISDTYSGTNSSTLHHLCYEFARSYGKECGASPIENLNASLVGNPEDYFRIGRNHYTYPILNYYLQYAYCSRFIDFNQIDSILELGSGSGKQVEVIKKLHPHIRFYLLDIPPQLYVCHQYLKAVFPEDVVPYAYSRGRKPIGNEPGKIHFFLPEKISTSEDLEYDFFWNSASFQEMEPAVVANYLKYVNRQAGSVYLHQDMNGQNTARSEGECGVMRPTRLSDYVQGLGGFEMVNLENSMSLPDMRTSTRFSFWKRKS